MGMECISILDYNEQEVHQYHPESIEQCFPFRDNANVTWINVSQLDKDIVHKLCLHYNIHYLLELDILSKGQRPKLDEQDNIIFCLLNMLRINQQDNSVDKEQISIVLGPGFILTFQEEPHFDAFENIRQSIKADKSRIRTKGADFLCYALLDAIVDAYQDIIDDFGDRIESEEDALVLSKDFNFSIKEVTRLRKDLMLLRRNILPVRELVNNFLKTNNPLIDKKTERYFKDVYDHILQAQDIMESYHDSMSNLHDLYLNKSSLKMNESMNVMAIVTCLLAPATVIGGIFGMNFDHIPFLHDYNSFWVIIIFLFVVFLLMLVYFRKKKWI